MLENDLQKKKFVNFNAGKTVFSSVSPTLEKQIQLPT